MKNKKPSPWRTVIGMMISPSAALKSAFDSKWYFSAMISSLAFGLFFFQTGLDLYKTGQKEMTFLFVSAAAGIGYGLLVIPLISVVVWTILKLFKTDKGIASAVSSLCLSYSGALIYGLIGIIFSFALEWKTSVAFGVSGVLWAIGPMIYTIRGLTGGKTGVSVFISTMVGAAVLISWSFFGNL